MPPSGPPNVPRDAAHRRKAGARSTTRTVMPRMAQATQGHRLARRRRGQPSATASRTDVSAEREAPTRSVSETRWRASSRVEKPP
jgi:hypothetical protein